MLHKYIQFEFENLPVPVLRVDEAPHHLAVLGNPPASSRLLRVESLELCTRYMKIFIEVLFTVIVGALPPKPRPAGGLACGAFRSRLARRRRPPSFAAKGLLPGARNAVQC